METRVRILVVDDEPNVRLTFRAALEAAGYEVAEAADVAEALARLERAPADLVLLDLRLPGAGGLELLRRLRDEGIDVPVVIVTAHGSIPDAVAAMRLGAVDFVAKPLTPEALRRTVAGVVGRPAEPEAVTAGGQLAANLRRAKRAFHRRAFDEAEVFLRQAIGLDPASAEAHNLLGVLRELRGEPGAFDEYCSAVGADPDYEPARHNLQRHYERIYAGRAITPVDPGIN